MLKKPRILVVGSLSMDLTASARRAPGAGETVIGLSFSTAPGGKGANQAVQCARLGARTTFVGQVGADPFGSSLLETVEAQGVDTSRVTVDPSAPTGVAQILLEITDQGAQNRITACPGANFTLTVDQVSWLEGAIGDYDMVLLQFELPMAVNEAVAGWARAAGVPVMVNPAPAAPLSPALTACATYLSPNEYEAAALSGLPIRSDAAGFSLEDVAAAAMDLRAQGAAYVLVTLGEHGAVLAGPEGLQQTPCVRMPQVADPTAAGDSFVAAFCTGLCAGLSQGEALTFASHAAALTVSRSGAMPSLPTAAQVQTLLRERGCSAFDPGLLDALAGNPPARPRACLKHVNMPNQRGFCPLDGAIFP